MNSIHFKYSLLIILLTGIFLWPFFPDGIPVTHDGEVHVVRIAAYFKAIRDGQIPPRWAGDLNYGFGSPALSFSYPLAGYMGSALHAVGVSYETGYKFIAAMSFILAPLAFYRWMIRRFPPFASFTGALFYGLAPYHFLDLYVRGAIGEVMAFVWVPVILLSLENAVTEKSKGRRPVLIGGISIALLMLSNNGIAVLFMPIMVCYSLILLYQVQKKNRTAAALRIILILLSGLALSAFYWFPALAEQRYLASGAIREMTYRDNFASALQLLIPIWGFGSGVYEEGGLSPHIGPLHIGVVIVTLYFLQRRKDERIISLFWLFIFYAGVLMAQSASEPLWSRISLLQQLQFPWKFTAVSSFAASVLAVSLFSHVRRRFIVIGTLLTLIILSVPLSTVIGHAENPDTYYEEFPGTTLYHSEATTRWTTGDAYEFPLQQIEVIGGQGTVDDIAIKSTMHSFSVHADGDVILLDNTVYFPGWRAYVDSEKVPVEFQDPNNRGLITFRVPEGDHRVTVLFGETPVRAAADGVTVLTVLSLIGWSMSRLRFMRRMRVMGRM
ncbi:MAG TPA: 6-pyruvoyl-tetrahydropterin synthase-related protein [Patescibacteria group bacterium]|nr:6-pyruvoyl-tetrahydropterin synthase-related protein [Patescibacteria group bacterium]